MRDLIYKLILIFICFFIFITHTKSGWNTLNSPENINLYGIYFKDINTGIAGRNKTTNGGLSWYQPSTSTGFALFFIDQNTGYFVGSGIRKTTNLGENWSSQTNPTNIMYAVNFPNVNTGYASGETGKIIKTTNAGSNWTIIPSGVPTSYYLEGIFFTDVNTGYVCGYLTSDYSSVILKTTDGGGNWSPQNYASGTGFNSIYFINPNTGIVIGQKIYRTTNGGGSWNNIVTTISIFSTELYFPSQNTGYCSGFGGTIIKTTDAGLTWFQQTTGTGDILRSIYFINDNTGFACGNGGIVLKTTDGGGPPIGIKRISNDVPDKFSLSQNYPNPFNPVTNINFSIPQKSYVKIIIYDATGKIIDELVNFELNSGTYKIDWQAEQFASGVYYYSLHAGDYKESRKMILIK